MLSIVLLLSTLTLAPTGIAHPATVCRVSDDANSCYFECKAGEVLRVDAHSEFGGSWPSVTATCGGVTVSCESKDACSRSSSVIVLFDDVGTCTADSLDVVGSCKSAHNDQEGILGSQCMITEDYDTCSFLCKPGDRVYVYAKSTVSPGWPRVDADCGGVTASCQSYMQCHASSSDLSAGLAWGTCHARTYATHAMCMAD